MSPDRTQRIAEKIAETDPLAYADEIAAVLSPMVVFSDETVLIGWVDGEREFHSSEALPVYGTVEHEEFLRAHYPAFMLKRHLAAREVLTSQEDA